MVFASTSRFLLLGLLFFTPLSTRAGRPSGLLLKIISFSSPATLWSQGSQEEDEEPDRLFQSAQKEHAQGDQLARSGHKDEAKTYIERALRLYEEALKLQPEFPEAEFQRGKALAVLGRLPEAEQAYKKALELHPEWPLAYSQLGILLARENHDKEAGPILLHTLQLDPANCAAINALADLRLRTGEPRGALDLLDKPPGNRCETAFSWTTRGLAQEAMGEHSEAISSLDKVLELEPSNASAYLKRAQIRLRTFEQSGNTSTPDSTGLKNAELDKVLADLQASERVGKNDEDARNDAALIFARLGELYRVQNPRVSLACYMHALELAPDNPGYATGYAAALVQARQFAQAVNILKRVLLKTPENYAAHANLATALDELKRYDEALVEYKWINSNRPDLAITWFFLARTLDLMGDLKSALPAYETFLARADPKVNQLEMDKVKLRLPPLRKQIQHGEGPRRKQATQAGAASVNFVETRGWGFQ